MDTTLPRSTCHKCGYGIDAASSMVGETPEPGDIGICLRCGNVEKYDENLQLTPLTDEDLIELVKDEDLWNYILKAKYIIKNKLWK